jgi:hypothetical protein
MAISTLCLLQLPTTASALQLPHVARVEALDDAVLLHTDLDFSETPESIASLIRAGLGEALAQQHRDPRGVLLIPAIAAPETRRYAAVVDEVGEGGVWAEWAAAQPQAPELAGLFEQMLGQMPASLMSAAAQMRADPSALQAATQALPGLLANPGELAQLVQDASTHMPELTNMLRGLGIDLSSPDVQRLSGDLASQLGRDPDKLAALAERLFEQAGPDDDDADGDTDESDED